jgi:hypothetical protein
MPTFFVLQESVCKRNYHRDLDILPCDTLYSLSVAVQYYSAKIISETE